jgi:hypothetical protein
MLRPPRRLSGGLPLYPAGRLDAESQSLGAVDGGQVKGLLSSSSGRASIPKPVDLLRLNLGGIINSRTRHLIKRYLKRVGFMNVKVVHLDCGPSEMTLLVTGQVDRDPTDEQRMKLKHLNDALTYTLAQPVAGLDLHPSHADPEILRKALSEMEPSLAKVYYTRA